MILLDTHIWVWWIDENQQLDERQRRVIHDNLHTGLAVRVISCWEVAKLVEYGRLEFACPVEEWMAQAVTCPGIQLLELTPRLAIESTRLPGNFHRDPADQLIVATSRVYAMPLLTMDGRILQYPYVRTL